MVYGIPNCDTVAKARRWLDSHGLSYQFHDFRKQGLEPDRLQSWIDMAGWETLLNRRSASWRALPEPVRARLDPQLAADLMLDNPTLIRRPVLEYRSQLLVGFDADRYAVLTGD